jgi:hypothetical protein
MQLKTAPLAALLSVVLMLVMTAPNASSQAFGEPGLTIDCKMLLSSLTSLDGSGSAEITYAGDAAVGLRTQVFRFYDANGDQWLDANETRTFLTAFSDSLIGKIYWGMAIKSVTNFTTKSSQYLEANTRGLVHSQWDSTDPIVFQVGFSGSGRIENKVVETAQGAYDAFAVAAADSTGYVFNGTLCVKQRVTTAMIGSFTTPRLDEGKLSAIRMPLGEVLWYSFTGHAGPDDEVTDTVTYETFSIMENQQISFVVLFIGGLMILRMPGKSFDKYEKLHPKKFRKFAKPLMSVKVSAVATAIVLVVLYGLPFMFSWASRNALLYAAYLYILVPAAVIGEYLFSRTMYGKAALTIPDESVVEVKQAVLEPKEGEGEILCKVCYRPIEAGLDIFQCSCGLTMHVDCAEKVQTCPSCGEPLFPERTRSIQCRACGETFMYSGAEDAYSIQCTKCGAFQEDIASGKNYLVVDEDSRNGFMMIRAMALSGRPAMCLTQQFPGKIRSEYDLRDMSIKWFSDSSTDIDNVNPKDLDGDSMEIVSTFLMTTKEAGVLVEGVETLIELNGFDKVLAFIKRLNDLAAIHGSTIIVTLNKKALPEEQFKAISNEFDEVHDYL